MQKSLIPTFTEVIDTLVFQSGRTRQHGTRQVANAIGTMARVGLPVIILMGFALAQNLRTASPVAMRGPAYDVSTGYTYAAVPIHGAGLVSLNGLDVSGSINWNARLGATLDTSFLRSSSVPGTTHQAYMLNTQVGPQFYPFERGKTRIFVRALGGAALIDGAAPGDATHVYHGWLVRPSIALGGGIERALSGPFAFRINGDYLRTLFYSANGTSVPQNNLRVTASLVFRMRKYSGTGW